jgi:serine/threonine protein kinase
LHLTSSFRRNIDLLKDSGEMNVVGMELAVSVMLSSLVRRGVCPNFVMTRGAFSSAFRPPATIWGNQENKCPSGDQYKSPMMKKQIRQPKRKGRYQYIRMELCDKGDAEEFMKNLPDERFDPLQARSLLFQMAYALHTAAIKFSLKHYDVKLLNFFIQSVQSKQLGTTVLRYRLGDHIFALKSARGTGWLAKLADYGTANVDATTNGQPVTLAQITTPENTPIDYILLGDSACQGHGHDNFGLGLCMLHLYTGHAPYEEIMEQVKCPPKLKRKLQELWECGVDNEFSIIQAHILHNVDKDETGHIVEGEPDEVLYHTLYRFLVLFGLPSDVSPRIRSSRVWIAVLECLDGSRLASKKNGKGKKKNDIAQYARDCRKFSIDHGTNTHIARAREALESMEGGIDLLKSLVSFDPDNRFTALDAMNSVFMEPLREPSGHVYAPDDDVRTYTIALN